jgi:putative membrane protein
VRAHDRRWWGLLLVPAVAAVVLLLSPPNRASADPGVPAPPNNLLTDRGVGAVTAADSDFVVRVRLAGLWEIPAGEMAQEKSRNPRIREIGKNIAAQHEVLDRLTREAAAKLKIKLPRAPNSDQQGWLGEMRDAEGDDFDRIYIDRLRAAHGKIFPAIATIRASTRNDTVRLLAQRANQFVMTHMTLLESSGIVDFKALPTAPPPGSAAPSPAASSIAAEPVSQTSEFSLAPVTLALVAGLVAGIFATLRLAGNRGGRNRRRRY